MPIRDLLNLIDTYNRVHRDKTNVEFEMQYEPNLSDIDKFTVFRTSIVKEHKFESHNFLRIFDKDSNATCVEFMNDKSKKIYKMHKTNIVSNKSGFDSTYYDNNIFGSLKVKLKYENIINDKTLPENPTLIRLSKRYIFDGFNPMWSLQITFIKNLTSHQQIKEWKIKMFDVNCQDESYFDNLQKWITNNDITMEIELEHHQTVDATRYGWPEVELYKLFFPTNNKADYLTKLRKVYRIVHPNRVFTVKNKVKNIVNQALETNRNETSEFWNECVHNNRVQIGPKPDGLRSLAIFERKETGEFSSIIVTDIDFMTVTFSTSVEEYFKEVGIYVLDVEWLENNTTLLADSQIKVIYPIVWANEFIFKKDFQVGLNLINEHIPRSMRVEFVEYTNIDNTFIKESIYCHLQDIYKKKDIDYPTDGIIVRTGNTYHTHKAIKIKPSSKIDFLIRKCPPELTNKMPYVTSIVKGCTEVYMLFVGMNRSKINDYHLKPINGYKSLFKNISTKDYYIPYHFSIISNDNNNHIWYSTESGEKDYDGMIAEFIYDIKTELWTLGVLREDKVGYGNDIATATSIWDNFHDPFTLEDIIESTSKKTAISYDNALLTNEHIRTITGIISTCNNKSNIIVVGTNYVCSKDIKRSHIMWPTSAMGPISDTIIKNVHIFTRNGSKITIDKNLDWDEHRSVILPGDLSAGSFIVILKVPEVGTDNSGIYFPIIKKRYINMVEEAGYLITIIDVPEIISNEVKEKITDPNNKLIKRAHSISLLENGDIRHIISWYKRSFSKENIEYQEIGLENPHLSKVYNYEQEENGNADINLKNVYTRQISTEGINIRINPKTKILDSSLVENQYMSQIISIVEFLIKVDNKYVELKTILIDDTIICVDGLEKLFPNYKFISEISEDLKVDVVVTWKNYIDTKDKFVKYNPWYIMCTLNVTDEMKQCDATMTLPKSSDKYYIPYKKWNNINTCIMHINKFRENSDTYVLRARLFIEQMIHFQYVLRPSLYKYVISEDLLRNGRFDGCYDCRTEILVLSRYLTYAKRNTDIEYCHHKTKTPEIIQLVDSFQSAYYMQNE